MNKTIVNTKIKTSYIKTVPKVNFISPLAVHMGSSGHKLSKDIGDLVTLVALF